MSETPTLPSVCWPVDTSCVEDWDAWRTPPDPGADPPVVGVPVYTDVQKARAVALATITLRALSGYTVGGCPVTVRPLPPPCAERTWRTYPVRGPGRVPWQPIYVGGQWRNVGCGCGAHSVIETILPAPASEVVEVKIDGAALDPTAYRLDPGGRLVRVDGNPWPIAQNLSAADSAPGTWSVTYTPGAAVDGLAAYAAGVLAGEFVKACAGGECALPSNVQQIVRDGITMTLAAGTFPDGKTGIREVDAWIESVNPGALLAPSMVWDPSRPRARVVAATPSGDGGSSGGGGLLP